MSACYVPMLERLRLASGGGKGSKSSSSRDISNNNVSIEWVEKPPQVRAVESKIGVTRQLQTSSSNNSGSRTVPRAGTAMPSRDRRGITLHREGFGNLPHDVVLSIRHDHPTLGLADFAQHQHPHQHQQHPHQQLLQHQQMLAMRQRLSQTPTREVALTPAEARGVLSLGLPTTLFRRSRGKKSKKISSGIVEDSLGGSKDRRRSLPRKLTRDRGGAEQISRGEAAMRTARSVTSLEDGDDEEDEDEEGGGTHNSTSTSGLSSRASSDNSNRANSNKTCSLPVPLPRTALPPTSSVPPPRAKGGFVLGRGRDQKSGDPWRRRHLKANMTARYR